MKTKLLKKLRKECLKRCVKKCYRVVEIEKGKFQIQCYQDWSVSSDCCPNYQWSPILLSREPKDKKSYIYLCNSLKMREIDKMVLEKIKLLRKKKYPKTIYEI